MGLALLVTAGSGVGPSSHRSTAQRGLVAWLRGSEQAALPSLVSGCEASFGSVLGRSLPGRCWGCPASSAESWGSGAPRGRAGVMGRKGRTGVGGRGGRRGRGKVGGEGGERSEESGARGGERRKTGWGEERHTHRDREFCNNLNSFQTMSKEPWQHGLKQTLPLIL